MTPNTRAVATAIVDAKFGADLQAAKDAKVAQLIAEQLKKVEPSFVYFEQKMQELAPMLDIFRVARLFDPSRVGMLAINANEVERQLKLLPFVDAPKVANLMAGLPAYLARAAARPRAIMGPLPQYMGSPHFFSHLKTTKIWVKIWVGPWGVRWAISGSVSSRKLELVDPTARFTEYFAF
jgi:hypothetical protein